MARTVDPVLQEKISDLISYEIEKSMLASSTAFDVLEKPVVPLLRKSPKRKQILILSVLIGLVLSSAGVFAWRGVQGIRAALGRRAASRRA
jgi:LPS O-antigen subunit length determinant protein (WzzB/FepE family)